MKINKDTTLGELQQYVRITMTERGFDDETIEQKLILLVEEVGELAKSIRKISGVKFAGDTRTKELAEEIADVQMLLTNIANKLDIDIADAVEAKEVKNRKRTWK